MTEETPAVEKDKRLYFTVPNDFHRHPKVRRLSDRAFRAFIEMLGEARLQNQDGVFERVDAEFMWEPEVLAELVNSHPTRPLVIATEDSYSLREYAKHQQTRADQERLAEVSRANGAKGGRPRKNPENPDITQGVSGKTQPKPKQTQTKAQSESESESELQTDLPIETSSVSRVSNAREDSTDSEEISEEQLQSIRRLANQRGLSLSKIASLGAKIGRELNEAQCLHIADLILQKAKRPPKNPMAYISATFRDSEIEVTQWIDRKEMGWD